VCCIKRFGLLGIGVFGEELYGACDGVGVDGVIVW